MESKEERSKRIHLNFESILPQLWKKAHENEEASKIVYMKTLHTKLLDDLRNHLSIPTFYTWFTDFSIEDISSDESIVFGTNTILKKERLESEYSSLLKTSLKSITNSDYEISFVVKEIDVPESLEGKSIDELFELSFGKEELERQKALYDSR